MSSDTTLPHDTWTDQHPGYSAESILKAATMPTGNDAGTRRHGFFVGDIAILLPADAVCEVTDKQQICKLPGAPEWLAGMTNLRGNIVPVFDLGLLLHIAESHDEQRAGSQNKKQLFIEIGKEWVGFYSDGLPLPVSLDPDEISDSLPAIPEGLRPYISRCYRQQHNWLDCDIKSLLLWIGSKF